MVHGRRGTPLAAAAVALAALAAGPAAGGPVPAESEADDSIISLLQERSLLSSRSLQGASVKEGPFAGRRYCHGVGFGQSQCFPDVMLVGQSKAGTTSMSMYLSQLPAMVMQKWKGPQMSLGNKPVLDEVHIFDNRFLPEASLRMMQWVTSPRIPQAQVDSTLQLHYTPNYMYYPDAPFLIKRVYPNAHSIRYLMMIRDPVKRAVSSWKFHTQLNMMPIKPGDSRTFEQVVDQGIAQRRALEACYSEALQRIGNALARRVDELPVPQMQEVTYGCFWDRDDTHDRTISEELPSAFMHAHVDKSVYVDQVKRWSAVLGRENFFVFSLEEWIADNVGTFTRIMDFIGLPAVGPGGFRDAAEMNRTLSVIYNEGEGLDIGAAPEDPDPALTQRLEEFYRPYTEELFEFLGRRLW